MPVGPPSPPAAARTPAAAAPAQHAPAKHSTYIMTPYHPFLSLLLELTHSVLSLAQPSAMVQHAHTVRTCTSQCNHFLG